MLTENDEEVTWSNEKETVFETMPDPEVSRNHMLDEDDPVEDEEEEPYNGAIPMDRIRNGASNAVSMWQWGFQMLKERANEASETIRNNENVKVVLAKTTPGVEAVKGVASVSFEKIKGGASVVVDAAKPKLDELREKTQPTFETISKSAGQTWESTKESLESFGNSCKPTLDKANNSTREFIEKVSTGKSTPQKKDSYEDI